MVKSFFLSDANGILEISGDGYMNEYSVDGLLPPWNAKKDSISIIVINNGIQSIGSYAFYQMNSVTTVTIPDSAQSIGVSTFEGCTSLVTVTIGKDVTTIGNKAFYECSSLKTVTFGEKVQSIGDDAFYKCMALTSIIIPDSVTSIGERAFLGCTAMTTVVYEGYSNPGTCTEYSFVSGVKVFVEESYSGSTFCGFSTISVACSSSHIMVVLAIFFLFFIL